jgi:DNA (cytosine-5)-methyltransferase 3A
LGSIVGLDTSVLPKIDLVIGGSPCQSFSRSGDNSGFDGKSGLFWEYIRVLNEIKPKYFLLENVVMKKEWEKIITDTIGFEPTMIDSKFFSAQKRQRLYWTNIPFDKNIEDRNINILDILKPIGDECTINNNPVVLEINEGIFKIKNGTKIGYLFAKNGDCVNLEFPKSKSRRGRVSNGKTNTLNTACNYGVIVNDNLRELNILEYERLQTLPDGYTAIAPLNQRKKMIGNGWTIDVISHIFKGL